MAQRTGVGIVPLDPSSDIIERELDLSSTAIEKKMGGDVLAFFGPILFGVEDFIRTAIEETKQKRSKLIVVLETPGGYVEVVQRIADDKTPLQESRIRDS
jgi:membrane-bound ClpP family serine protease